MRLIMKHRIQKTTVFSVMIMLALSTLAFGAPKGNRSRKHLTIEGRVISIDQENRTLVVNDRWSGKTYLVDVPENATFKITFGINMNLAEASFEDVHRKDRVRLECIRNQDHLSSLDNGRQVTAMKSAR